MLANSFSNILCRPQIRQKTHRTFPVIRVNRLSTLGHHWVARIENSFGSLQIQVRRIVKLFQTKRKARYISQIRFDYFLMGFHLESDHPLVFRLPIHTHHKIWLRVVYGIEVMGCCGKWYVNLEWVRFFLFISKWVLWNIFQIKPNKDYSGKNFAHQIYNFSTIILEFGPPNINKNTLK